ncbi:Non-hem dioxygenase N-terminal domain [Dillenia turbinata]|uniref:Non-hem dioxygenase N-terminal domain n=1 Tax=Dillenia turbinata TaxID=194707 RepID=A0AAN8VM73_9MAGN
MATTLEAISVAPSVPVLSLQELVKEPLSQVPDRYVCLNQDPLALFDEMPAVPVIDLKKLATEDITSSELEKLHSSCKEWGLFQLMNHGVSSSVIEKLKAEIEEFFKLPLEEKEKYQRKEGEAEGYGPIRYLSDDQKLDWVDRLYFMSNPLHIRKPHLMPNFPPSLRDTMELYLAELQKLSMKILGSMAEALKLKDKKEIEEIFDDGLQSVRINYYPPCPQPEKVIGCGAHSDASGITILTQVNQVEGLQFKKDGTWLPVNPHPDSFLVILGDALEHRVTVNSHTGRISIAVFFNPKLEANIGPATTLVNPQIPPLFKTVTMKQYIKEFFSRKLDGKTFLETMKIDYEASNGDCHV